MEIIKTHIIHRLMLNVAVVLIMLQDLRLLYPRCLLLHSQQKWPEFVQCAEQVLFGHFNVIFKEAHLNGKWSKEPHAIRCKTCIQYDYYPFFQLWIF